MIVSSATATPPGSAIKNTKSSTVDYESFLKLLVTQLQNQDPTAPTDASAFMSQLASFSNVEQAVRSNTKLDQLISMTQVNQAGGLIGRVATSADGSTSGLVKSVRIDANGLVASLDNGKTLNIGSGIGLS